MTINWSEQSTSGWKLSDMEKAMNDAGMPTPNGLSYYDDTVFTHDDDGNLIEMDQAAQDFADNWIQTYNAG
jgi:hypothetical protein